MRAIVWLLVGLAGLLTVLSVLHAAFCAQFLMSVVVHDGTLDGWVVLSAVELGLAILGVAGSWILLRRRAFRWVPLLLILQLPGPFLEAANSCDVIPTCQKTDWARLPPDFFSWRVSLAWGEHRDL